MNRYSHVRVVFLLLLSVVLLRLGYLQLLEFSHYRAMAERNRIRFVPEPSPRGIIFDRQGRVLAANHILFQASVIPQESDNLDDLLEHIGMLLGDSFETLRRRFRRARTYSFVPAAITPFISKDQALVLEEERWHLPGLHVLPVTARRYPFAAATGHVLGYLGKPTPEEAEQLKQFGVRADTRIGRTGIEKHMDAVLRGQPGSRVVEVDHRGHHQRTLEHREAWPGKSVKLTIDAGLQSLILTVFGDQPGAAVVIDPESGEVLAMVSNPSFDPGAFAVGDGQRINEYLKDPRHPLLNRATRGTYPPGSIAKLMVGAAGLEAGIINEHTRINCEGGLRIGDRVIHCWYRDGHGYLNLEEAITFSCNVFFMRVGRWLGLEQLRSTYERVGFSYETGWILGEREGHLPDRRLSQGEVAMLSIGQGPFLVTPLQVARMAAAIANGGWVIEPSIILEVDGKPAGRRPGRYRTGFSPAILETLKRGMAQVVEDPEGTGFRAHSEDIRIAGKTGTAQTGRAEQNHGWFAGFCAADDPRVAMAILAEFGGSGGDLPAQVARAVCEYVSATKL